MNEKQPYKPDHEIRPFLYDVTINGHRVQRGMEISVAGGLNRPAGRYRFSYAQEDAHGNLDLFVYGPVRRKAQRYRQIRTDVVVTVHVKSRDG